MKHEDSSHSSTFGMINSATSTCPHQHHRRKCFLAWKRRPYAQPRDGMQMMRRRHCQAEVMVCVVLICEEVMVRAAQRQRSRWSALVALRPPTARRSLEIPQNGQRPVAWVFRWRPCRGCRMPPSHKRVRRLALRRCCSIGSMGCHNSRRVFMSDYGLTSLNPRERQLGGIKGREGRCRDR